MDDYDDVQNWLSLSEVNTKENLSVGGRKLVADIRFCDAFSRYDCLKHYTYNSIFYDCYSIGMSALCTW